MTGATPEAPVRRKVLEVEDVRTRFHTRDGAVHAANGVSFDLHESELLGVVGESGSGKSMTMISLLKLLPMPPAEIVSGRARLDGEDLNGLDAKALRRVRGAGVGFVFQDPMTSLNPVLTVGCQIRSPSRCGRISAWAGRRRRSGRSSCSKGPASRPRRAVRATFRTSSRAGCASG